jgi:hypothetical protein
MILKSCCFLFSKIISYSNEKYRKRKRSIRQDGEKGKTVFQPPFPEGAYKKNPP